ncbi:MAG TPA: thioredoxin domain-containing protein [Gemmatimonadales bacterium]
MLTAPSVLPVRALLAGAVLPLLFACAPDAAPAAERGADVGATGESALAVAPDFALESQPDGAPARVVLHGVDLTGVGYDRGDPDAPILMVEFSDFGCPYCAQHALETFPALASEFVGSGRVFYKHVPFVMGMFPNGDRAARAAACAGEQDRFWPMYDSVYAHQAAWKRGRDPDAMLTGLARNVVPDAARWSSCYAGGGHGARTRAANDAARSLGIRATPTFFVNGQMVEGALPLPVLRQGLNAMLDELREP